MSCTTCELKFFQIGEPGHLFELREMFLQDIDVQRTMIQTIIPFVQGNTVIINKTCHIDLPVELSVSLCLVQLKAVGLHFLTSFAMLSGSRWVAFIPSMKDYCKEKQKSIVRLQMLAQIRWTRIG